MSFTSAIGSSQSQPSHSRSSQSSKNFSASSLPSFIQNDIAELFYDDQAKFLPVDGYVLHPKGIKSRYVFTHKAIWCTELIQSNFLSGTLCFLGKVAVNTPYLEHWAFVARGTIPGMDDMVAYFVAQFGPEDYIPTELLRKYKPEKYKFNAMLVENDKRAAALTICTTKERSRVWIRPKQFINVPLVNIVTEPINRGMVANATNILTHPGGKLVTTQFEPNNWDKIKKPLKLSELDEFMFKTRCSGKEYSFTENNCQAFAGHLYKLVG